MTETEFLSAEHTLQRHVYDELLSRVKVHVTGCWLWDGPVIGGTEVMRVSGVLVPARDLMYTAKRGAIPKDKEVRTACLAKNCINPKHLYLATPKEFTA